MADVDLLFQQTPLAQPAELVFGDVESSADADVTFSAVLPLTFNAFVGPIFDVTFSATFPLSFGCTVAYDNYVDRPVVAHIESQHQDAAAIEVGAQEGMTRGLQTIGDAPTRWTPAAALRAGAESAFESASRAERASAASRFQDAARLPSARVRGRHQDGLRDRRLVLRGAYQDAAPVRTSRHTDWQDRHRDRRPSRSSRYQDATPVPAGWVAPFGAGTPVLVGQIGRYQDAKRPPGGVAGTVQPPFDPCYLPDPHLLFANAPIGPALVFWCERHGDGGDPDPPGPVATVVVPIRSIYIVHNSVTLRRVAGSLLLPVLDFSLQIDADSWTWSFSATLPYGELGNVQPSGGDPVELEATINGVPYRLIAERLTTDRSFERTALKIAGRGRNAVLADPYAERKTFSAAGALTAQQLMEDALTDNGIPIGWTVDFGLTDWNVPGGTWAHQGTYLTALRTIAEAAGGYIQPHRTDQVLRVLPRYPAAPWGWAGLTPDFELPSAVTTVEAIEWIDKPIYNRVFVMGERNGRVGRVTRAGTAGDAVAPSVVHPLITAIDASRQRGLAVLSDVGRQAHVSLQLPVLSETGVIPPGSLVRYLDGPTTRLGLVRTTSVAGAVQLRQTLGIETHVAP